MATNPIVIDEAAGGDLSLGEVSRRSRTRLLLRIRLAVIGLAIVVFWVLISLLSPVLPLRDPYNEDLSHRLQGPGIAGNLLGNTTNADLYAPLAVVRFAHLHGHPARPAPAPAR